MHTFPAVADCPNVYPDLSGSGVDRGMLDAAIASLGAERLLWGCDLTMCTGLAKLRALDVIGLSDADLSNIRWRNAARIFPAGSFPRCGQIAGVAAGGGTMKDLNPTIDVNTFIGPYPFRHVPHPDPDVLVRVLDREGMRQAWVGHLPSAFYRDPTPGNAALYADAARRSRSACGRCRRFGPTGRGGSRRCATPRRPERRRFVPTRRSGVLARMMRRCASSRSRRESRAWRSCSPCDSRICASDTAWTLPAI